MRIDDPNIQGSLTFAAGSTSSLTGSFSGSIEGNSVISGSLSGSFQGNGTELTGIVSSSINNNQVSFDNLENRYTTFSALVASSNTFSLDFNTATTFTATAGAASAVVFSNAVQGQVVDLLMTGDYTITFSETGATFYKVGSTDYDGSVNNIIQVVCTNDTSGAKNYHYSIATYTSDTTP